MQTISVAEDGEKSEPTYTAGENESGAATVENSMMVPQNIKH